jgi:hypothetical protein
MRFILSDAIEACRVYFTGYDRVTYSQVAWTNDEVGQITQGLARKLKLLVLTKGHVVMAASHLLESELAHGLVLEHPRLFSEGVIVPALRSEFATFQAFLEAKIAEGKEADVYDGAARLEVAQRLDSVTQTAVLWTAQTTSQWFRDRMVAELADECSLLSASFRHAGLTKPDDLLRQVREAPTLARGDVYRIAQATGDLRVWELVCDYTDFLYYLSGALAVRSEGVLPQENLVDFTTEDLVGGATRLSDMEIFFKLFVDIVKTATHAYFPADLLDALTVEDCLDLHHVAIDGRFIEKYNAIQELTKRGLEVRDPERLVLLMDEMEAFEHDLRCRYSAAIGRELPAYRRDLKEREVLHILSAVTSLLLPFWSALKDAKGILVSGLSLGGQDQIVTRANRRIEQYMDACDQFLDHRDLKEKPVLLQFAKKMKQRYLEGMTG